MNLLIKTPATIRRVSLIFLLAMATTIAAFAGELKLEAQLIWGTDDAKSPDPKHKPVDPDLRKKLDDLPLKWKNYFEVNRKRFNVPKKGSNKVSMSEKCELEVKNIDGKSVEVSLISKRKGDTLWKRTQPLPKGEILIYSGNAPNSTAWLVTLKQVE